MAAAAAPAAAAADRDNLARDSAFRRAFPWRVILNRDGCGRCFHDRRPEALNPVGVGGGTGHVGSPVSTTGTSGEGLGCPGPDEDLLSRQRQPWAPKFAVTVTNFGVMMLIMRKMVDLDSFDRRLLELVRADNLQPARVLADKVGVSLENPIRLILRGSFGQIKGLPVPILRTYFKRSI